MDYEKSNQSGILKLTLDPVLFSWLYVAIVVSAFPLVELSVDALGTQKRKERKSVLVRLQTGFWFYRAQCTIFPSSPFNLHSISKEFILR